MHTTLGQKFYTKFVSSITRRRKQVRRSYWCESSRILISRRFAPVAPLDLLSASSYRRNKFRIEFLSQGRMHFFRFFAVFHVFKSLIEGFPNRSLRPKGFWRLVRPGLGNRARTVFRSRKPVSYTHLTLPTSNSV